MLHRRRHRRLEFDFFEKKKMNRQDRWKIVRMPFAGPFSVWKAAEMFSRIPDFTANCAYSYWIILVSLLSSSSYSFGGWSSNNRCQCGSDSQCPYRDEQLIVFESLLSNTDFSTVAADDLTTNRLEKFIFISFYHLIKCIERIVSLYESLGSLKSLKSFSIFKSHFSWINHNCDNSHSWGTQVIFQFKIDKRFAATPSFFFWLSPEKLYWKVKKTRLTKIYCFMKERMETIPIILYYHQNLLWVQRITSRKV